METLEEVRARIRALVSGPGKTSRWVLSHLDHADGDWCLIWPFSWEEDHYPKYKNQTGGRQWPVHRLMCEYRHGEPPSASHHSAHSCNRGTEGCCNPMHVSWKTPSENQFDRSMGLPRRREKLTAEQVDQIKALEGRQRPIDIARQFGTTQRNIRLIFSGQTWRDPSSKHRHFTEDEVLAIRGAPSTVPTAALVPQYLGANYSQIQRIRTGKSYAWVNGRP